MQNLFFKQGLKELAKENMTREQITAFCVEQTGYNGEGEIGLLCNEKLIDMVSEPYWDHGVFVPKPYDLFGIADCGKDRLADIGKERFRFYFPIIISVLSLIVSNFGMFSKKWHFKISSLFF